MFSEEGIYGATVNLPQTMEFLFSFQKFFTLGNMRPTARGG